MPMLSPSSRSRAFTLIELLIVVSIIAILAAIALPNFLAAQVRAKFTRCVADLRTVALAIEAYAVDTNHYPPNTRFNNYSVPPHVTTPIAYISQSRLRDPFASVRSANPGTYASHPYNLGNDPEDVQLYTYQSIHTLADALKFPPALEPPADAIDSPGYNPGAFQRYGHWKLVSFGPDGYYTDPSKSLLLNLIQTTFDIPYDPTNGTVSFGNIYRTHRSSTGEGTRKP